MLWAVQIYNKGRVLDGGKLSHVQGKSYSNCKIISGDEIT